MVERGERGGKIYLELILELEGVSCYLNTFGRIKHSPPGKRPEHTPRRTMNLEEATMHP